MHAAHAYPELVRTERLRLERWRRGDLEEVLAVWAAGDVWERLRPGMAYDEALARAGFDRHLEQWAEYGFGLWTVREPPDQTVLGWVGASYPAFVPELAGEVEVGWTLRPEARGRGLAREAGRAACEAALSSLGVPRVVSLIHPSNEPSRAVAIAIGMRLGGRVRHVQLGEEVEVYSLSPGRAGL